MKDLTWRHVAAIALFLGAFTVIVSLGKDSGALVAAVLGILGALGYVGSQVAAVKTQTNGNTSELTGLVREMAAHIKEQGQMMATMQPTQATEDVRPVSPAH